MGFFTSREESSWNPLLLHQAFCALILLRGVTRSRAQSFPPARRPARLPSAPSLPLTSRSPELTKHVLGARRWRGSDYLVQHPPFLRLCVYPSYPQSPVTQHPSSDPGGVARMGFSLVRRAGFSPAGIRVHGRAETAGAERECGRGQVGGRGKRCV